MREFLVRLLGGIPAPALPAPSAAEAPAPALAVDVAAVADAVLKLSRAQARISLKLDDVEGKLEAGFADLRSVSRAAPNTDALRGLGPVLDALDLLDEVAHTARRAGDTALADGIVGIGVRLSDVIADAGLARIGTAGLAPDAKLLRVVGTEDGGDLPAGVVTRVVRAAVVAGDKVLREGEVLVAVKGENHEPT